MAATSVQAQSMSPPPGARYFSGFWLSMFLVNSVVWLATTDWMGRDAEKVKLRHQLWVGLGLLAGALGTALMLLAHITFVFISLLGMFTLFGIYVYRRNLLVPPTQKVFTPDHLAFCLRNLAAKLKLVKTVPTRSASDGEDMTSITLLRKDGKTLEAIAQGRGSAEASEAVMSIKELIESAVLSRATDVHLEPKEGELQARFRIDGILHNVPSYESALAAPMVSSVKVLSDMDIAEKRKPQDGTFMGKLEDRTLDFRVVHRAQRAWRNHGDPHPRPVHRPHQHGETRVSRQGSPDSQEGHQLSPWHVDRQRPHGIGQDHVALLHALRVGRLPEEHPHH